MKTLGIGRLCLDEHYYIDNSSSRINSTKLALDSVFCDYGGSVPRILSCLSSAGYDAHFWGASDPKTSSHQLLVKSLSEQGIACNLIQKSNVPRSFVLYGRDNTLHSILSVNETSEAQVSFLDMGTDYLCELDPDCIVTDIRHLDASLGIADWACRNGKTVFLDPGSSQVSRFLSKSEKAYKLLPLCHIICASDEFFRLFCPDGNLHSLFSHSLFSNLTLAICTMSNGINVVASAAGSFSITRNCDITIGNSFGTGDIFRGWFLADFLEEKDCSYNSVVHAVKMAIAAATIHIQDRAIVKKPLTRNLVYEKFCEMPCKILDDCNMSALSAD